MKEKPLFKELQRVIQQYKRFFGVLEYVIFIFDDKDFDSIYTISQRAAIEGLKIVGKRDDDYFLNEKELHEEKCDKLFKIEIFNEYPEGQELTIEEFFGPWFDFKKKKLTLRGQHKDFLNEYFYAGDEEKGECSI